MKNQLESWEVGLGDRLKEHEFSFDPEAMAGFEALLAAETAVAGQPERPPAVAPGPASGNALAAKLFALLGGALLIGGLLYLGLRTPPAEQTDEVAVEAISPRAAGPIPQEQSEVAPAPAPITTPAPVRQAQGPPVAAAPPVRRRTEGRQAGEPLDNGGASPLFAPDPGRSRPRPLPTDGLPPPAPSPRRPLPIAPMRVHKPITALPVPERKLPEVKVLPAGVYRDTTKLLPKVSKHWP